MVLRIDILVLLQICGTFFRSCAHTLAHRAMTTLLNSITHMIAYATSNA
jgi:hypothetical protein